MKLSLIERTLKLYEQSQGYFSFLFSTPPIIKALQVLYKKLVNEFNNSSSNSTVRDPDLTKSQVEQLLFVLDRSPFAKDFYLQELIQTVHNELRHHIAPSIVKEPPTIVVKNLPAVSSNEVKQTEQKNKKTEQLETALLALKAAGILTEENRTACTTTLGKRVRFVSVLQDASLLNQKNFVVLVSDAAMSYEFHDAFIYVQHAKLLTQTHFDMIAHEPISVMNKIICNSFAHRDLDIDFHNNENEANAFAWVLVHLRSRNLI